VLFGSKCGYCNQIITGQFVKACGKTWHSEHFHCHQCKGSLANGFYDKEG